MGFCYISCRCTSWRWEWKWKCTRASSLLCLKTQKVCLFEWLSPVDKEILRPSGNTWLWWKIIEGREKSFGVFPMVFFILITRLAEVCGLTVSVRTKVCLLTFVLNSWELGNKNDWYSIQTKWQTFVKVWFNVHTRMLDFLNK